MSQPIRTQKNRDLLFLAMLVVGFITLGLAMANAFPTTFIVLTVILAIVIVAGISFLRFLYGRR